LGAELLEDRTLLSNPATTGELIAAINDANNAGTPTTITLADATLFSFTSADNSTDGPTAMPVITGNITIEGESDTLLGSGARANRFASLTSGAAAA
jgi:hypothetical protein